MDTKTLAIKRVPLDSLHLDPSNARTHGTENLEAIKGSLLRFGQAEPLVVQARSRRVIGGNGRLVAMPVVWAEQREAFLPSSIRATHTPTGENLRTEGQNVLAGSTASR